MTTLAQAEVALEYLGRSGVNAVQLKDWQKELDEAKAKARVVADTFYQERERDFTAERQTLLEEGSQICDALEALAGEGETGQLTLDEYRLRFLDLTAKLRANLRRTGELGATLERLDTIEEDPIAWVDATYYSKYETLSPTFTFA
jgi:hypothetical protein